MLERWIDKNGLIKPQETWTDSGNGVLYTVVYLMVTGFNGIEGFTHPIGKCFQHGLLFRTPPTKEQPFGAYGQEQWDNWLGIAAMCALRGFHKMARMALWFGIKHFGFYDSDGKLEGKDWLWRFPQVWTLMVRAAFPMLHWPLFPLFKLISMFMNPAVSDQSGSQLAWVYLRTVHCLYPGKFDKLYQKYFEQFKNNCGFYYGQGHPTVDGVRALFEREKMEGWKCITLP